MQLAFGILVLATWSGRQGTMVPELLNELIREHYAATYRYLYWLSGRAADAEDLTQETFLRAQKCLHQLREPASAGSWLLRIARNTFLKRRQLRSRSERSLESTAEPVAEAIDSWCDPERLRRVLAEMPAEYRDAVLLFYFDELKYREISDQLDVPIGTVMSRISRGKAWLKSRLQTLDAQPTSVAVSDSIARAAASQPLSNGVTDDVRLANGVSVNGVAAGGVAGKSASSGNATTNVVLTDALPVVRRAAPVAT